MATYFENPEQFREWLQENHKTATELLVGFYKVGSGKSSMTWPESVDQALCFGWIDGIRKRVDDESYTIRFTPRKPNSIWSAVNIAKMAELENAGLLKPAGIVAFQKRKETKSKIYSYEKAPSKLSEDHEKLFRENPEAWKFFSSQPPGYQKIMVHWITDAKQEVTRLARLEKTIAASAEKKRLR